MAHPGSALVGLTTGLINTTRVAELRQAIVACVLTEAGHVHAQTYDAVKAIGTADATRAAKLRMRASTKRGRRETRAASLGVFWSRVGTNGRVWRVWHRVGIAAIQQDLPPQITLSADSPDAKEIHSKRGLKQLSVVGSEVCHTQAVEYQGRQWIVPPLRVVSITQYG